ncbi:Dol-P-Man:Man(5)GlcNAc(2)-PP-Dol alpha-1,3-mannosyltransferase [Toxocara canis]|uniref:dolichyl-P-Man:Man5GlcNAc2-PP-dolichol alpha-1,3-mannosyltransferase n=1 Tax=Toxocara canis TaxID=6265 RepID=A0A0B2VZG3_TOXCA|nr:Dol-P-Man:Man(5)GlcNAc(2)-PP-Dol alpha-1,3-mannosyltransferase [Toxocara canis]
MMFSERPVVKWLSSLLLTVNSTGFILTSLLILLAESLLCTLIIWNVPYTEIDWSTYMQQVGCYIRGTRNYSLIEGDTGPVLYPAGHIFVYRLLNGLTDGGKDIRRGQYIFEAFYLLTLVLVFRIYHKSKKMPPFVLLFLCCISYRIHSIFILRLFNDPIAMLLFYAALNFWISHQWLAGCVFYSLAVSVKMNILLFAPAVFFVLLLNNGPAKTAVFLGVCAVIQVLIALPFLLYDPMSYLKRSFDLGRVFLFKWTVNWRLLPEHVFLDKRLHLALLIAHALLLMVFASKIWFRSHGGLILLLHKLSRGLRTRIGTDEVLMALFTANLLGISVARSLHYQFYSWYFHSLPYLLFSTVPFEVIPDTGVNVTANKLKNRLKGFPFFPVLLRYAFVSFMFLCFFLRHFSAKCSYSRSLMCCSKRLVSR